LRLAWPVVLARATQSVIGFSDALMVAPLGEDALAAVTTGALNSFVIVILPMGTVFIVQSFAAQLRGRGRLEDAVRYAWYGLILAGMATLLSVLSAPGVGWALSHFDYSAPVHDLMSGYVTIRLLSVGFAVGMEALGNWYGGLGRTQPAMVAGIVAMVSNVAGNYLLIEPRWGLPGFGVVGAAWASSLGNVLGFLTLLGLFLTGHGYRAAGPHRLGRALGLRWDELGRVLRFGLPNGINWFLEFAGFMLFINVFIAGLGTPALAAFSVVLQVNSVAFMPAFGLASAGAIFVGEAIGADRKDEVKNIVRLTATVGAIWMVTVGAVYATMPAYIMSWFRPAPAGAEAFMSAAVTMLSMASIWQVFDALGLTLSEALRAAGDTAWCMGARIVVAWLVFLPAGWVGMRVWPGGPVTAMAIVAGYVALLAVALGARFASGRWRKISLIDLDPVLV
jgi:MATE family multidrug resistance protein